MTFPPFRLRTVLFATAACIALSSGANAAILLETASFTGNDPGDYIVQGDGTNGNNRFIGASFTLTHAADITSIGLGLGRYSSGAIFAAIVPLDTATAFPSVYPASLASIALGSVVFSVPSTTTDFSTLFTLHLAAGNYGIVFGSGLFGASGFAAITDGNDTIGAPILFQNLFGADWLSQSADGIRIVVEGTELPEPSSIAVLGMSLLGLGLVRRRTVSI
jgi:hypothetical protein